MRKEYKYFEGKTSKIVKIGVRILILNKAYNI